MIKHILIVLIFILCATTTFAQLALGGGIAYTTNTDDIGAQIKSQYTFGDNWRAELSFDNYVTEGLNFYGDINLNIHYIFTQTEGIQLHLLAGGALFYGSTRSVDFVEKGRAQGINAGLGFQYNANENLKYFFDTVFTYTDFGNPGKANRFLFSMGALYVFEP